MRLKTPPSQSPRLLFFYAALFFSASVLLCRLLYLQIVEHSGYAELAYENRVSRVNDPAPRGVIYDRRGVQLVRNVPSYNIVITPAYLPDDPDPLDNAIDAAQTQAIYRRLAEVLGIPIVVPGSTPQAACRPGRGIKDLVDEGAGFQPYTPVKIKCDVSKEVALLIHGELEDMPGVDVVVEPVRDYPTGMLTADIIGYMAPIPNPNESLYFRRLYNYYLSRGLISGRDRIGVTGVESALQDTLAGRNGSRLIEVDVGGRELRTLTVETETLPGLNVQLTIDARLQTAAEAALRKRLEQINAYNPDRFQLTSGVVIVMNPLNGEVLAMVSWPSYDNNRFARSIDYPYYVALSNTVEAPMINHAVAGLYPPGSTFKIVTATGVLEEGVIDPNQQLMDKGFIEVPIKYSIGDPNVGKRVKEFVCWKWQHGAGSGHGLVDFLHGMAWSCDVYFYKIGGGWVDENVDGLQIDKLNHWMELFGFGDYTGIELPGEQPGFIPGKDWKRITYSESWSTGDTYNAVIGQGFVVSTPLQMLNAANVVINGGYLYQPTLVDKILDGEGNVLTETQPILIEHTDSKGNPLPNPLPISQETLRLVREGMHMAVVDPDGTFSGPRQFGYENPIIDVPGVELAGKTGTAEYCDMIAWKKGKCYDVNFMPTHAWSVLYGPYDNPEVSVIAFVYDGGEGSKAAGPIANDVLRAYFEYKAADAAGAAAQP